MIKNYSAYLKENIKWYSKGNFEEDNSINDSEKEYSVIDSLKYKKCEVGDEVMCINDTVNNRSVIEQKPIKKGEFHTIKGIGSGVWFMDTPGGWGVYPLEDFVKI